jgi:hypothetical protein
MSDTGRARPGSWRLLLVLLVLALAGCATIPTSGPVRAGDDLPQGRVEEGVSAIGQDPAKDASPEDIVLGFLQSGADFVNDHEVARKYLTPTARQRWRPQAGTVVYESSLAVRSSGGGAKVSVDGAEVGRIDAEGSFQRSGADGTVTRDFGLSKIDGQWRIDTLDDGLLLPLTDVGDTYRQFSLYFLAPSGGTLVPDPVLLPELPGLPGLSTKLVARLLRGPTSGTREGVTTAFPPGTELEVGSVPVSSDGLATVRLDASALEANDDAREQMSAQIVWTLKQLPEVQKVRITAGGENLVVSGVAQDIPRDAWATYDPDDLPASTSAYVVDRAGRIGRYLTTADATRFDPVAGEAGTGNLDLRTPAVSLDARRVAAVGDGGGTVYVGPMARDGRLEPRVHGKDLSQPSWDPGNNLWVVDRATGQLWYLADGADAPQEVSVPPLANDRKPVAVAVARDGARVALVVGTGRNARLRLLAVRRDPTDPSVATGERLSLVNPRDPLPDLRDVRDVSWADSTFLAVLGSRDGGPVQPQYLSVDGYEVRDVEPLADQTTLSAASPPGQPQPYPLMAGTSNGELWQFTSGGGWVLVGPGSDPTYPG